MVIDAQTIITAGAVLTALTGIFALGWKLFKWVDHQKEQDQEVARVETKFDKEIARVEKKLDKEISDVRTMHNNDQCGIQEEQTLVVYGLLACLKGLAEQGCDGPVSEAIDRIEKHINKKAHGQRRRE